MRKKTDHAGGGDFGGRVSQLERTVCKVGMGSSSGGGTVFMKVRISNKTTHVKHVTGTS